MVVPKKNGKWRECVDYSNLNDVCPKDTFPLPRVNQIIDATADHQLLSFPDAYFGYNKIPIYPLDSANIAFITPIGMSCYNVMPFGLKNVGATYQRMMSCIFEPLLGRTMEAYIDDMLVKLKSREDHITHLQDAFWLMRLHRLWLNLDKCAFRVGFGNFIRFLISQRGIEMPPEKAKVIGQLQPPHNQDADTNSHRQISGPQQVYLQIFGSLQPFFIALKGASLRVGAGV